MTTIYELGDYIYRLVKASDIATTITGSVYHEDQRPVDSKAEDATVNVMPFNNTARPYWAYVNVNVYIPYMSVVDGNGRQMMVPDRNRQKAVAAVVDRVLRGASTESLPVAIERTSTLEYKLVNQSCYNTLIYCMLND